MDTTGPGPWFRSELLPVGSKSRKDVVRRPFGIDNQELNKDLAAVIDSVGSMRSRYGDLGEHSPKSRSRHFYRNTFTETRSPRVGFSRGASRLVRPCQAGGGREPWPASQFRLSQGGGLPV